MLQSKNNLTKFRISPSIWKITLQVWKFPWSFGFSSWLSNHVFITNWGVGVGGGVNSVYRYVYILRVLLDIFDKLTHNFQNVCGYWTLNEPNNEITSLMICLIKYNLINTSSTHPPVATEKSSLSIYFNNFVYLKRNEHSLKI